MTVRIFTTEIPTALLVPNAKEQVLLDLSSVEELIKQTKTSEWKAYGDAPSRTAIFKELGIKNPIALASLPLWEAEFNIGDILFVGLVDPGWSSQVASCYPWSWQWLKATKHRKGIFNLRR